MARLLGLAAAALVLAAGAPRAAEWSKLMDPATAEATIAGGGVTVVDIRSPEHYGSGHLPGALNAPYGSWRGPKENPGRRLSDARLTERMQSLGLEPGDAVLVTYQGANTTDFGAAARVYWTLKSAGLTRLAILNGGVNAWAAAGKPLSTEPVAAERSSASFTLSDEWLITREGVAEVLAGARQATMIDARPMSFWEGQKKHPAAKRAGTLPGALQITHDTWFEGSKTTLTADDHVLDLARKAGYRPDGRELVSFCNTGHWAATNWFAMSELAGIDGVKLYPESMVGWANSGGTLMNEPR